jgi:hypothetical protein
MFLNLGTPFFDSMKKYGKKEYLCRQLSVSLPSQISFWLWVIEKVCAHWTPFIGARGS